MRRKIVTLIGGTLAFGGSVALISHYIWPETPIPLFSLIAMLLCLLPTVGTLILASRTMKRPAEDRLLVVFGGMAFRMTTVLGAGLLLYYTVPTFERISFWIVLLGFYLVTLGLEVGCLATGWTEQEKIK